MSDLTLLVRLQARIATFLAELSADQLVAFAEGRVTLALRDGARQDQLAVEAKPVTTRSPRRASSAESFDGEAIIAQLRSCGTLDEATERLATLRLSAADLKLLAKALNITPGRTKDDTAKRILNLTVGSRSKHAGLRQG